jgi:hypothetical protein
LPSAQKFGFLLAEDRRAGIFSEGRGCLVYSGATEGIDGS